MTLVLAAAVFAMTVVESPFFGNMDDGAFLQLAAEMGPIDFGLHLSGSGSGFLRPVSMTLVWPSYRLGVSFGPIWLFLANSLVVLTCIGLFGLAVSRALGWRSAPTYVAFLAVTLTWPYTAEMFFFPSLSEKGVVLGAAALVGWAAVASRIHSHLAFWSSLGLVLCIAFTTKTQILIFVPGAIATGDVPGGGGFSALSVVLSTT